MTRRCTYTARERTRKSQHSSRRREEAHASDANINRVARTASHRVSAFVDASSLVRTSAPTCDSCRRCDSLSSASFESNRIEHFSWLAIGSPSVGVRTSAHCSSVRSDAGVSVPHAAQRLRHEGEGERDALNGASSLHVTSLRTAHTLSTRNDARARVPHRITPRRAFHTRLWLWLWPWEQSTGQRSSSARHSTAHRIPYAQRLWHKSERAVAPYCGAPPHARRMRDTTRHNSTQQATRHGTPRRGAARRGTAHHSAFRFS